MKTKLNTAIVLTALKFDGKFDKGGNPYILHCLTVMHKLRTQDEELQQIAVMHDLIEDTDVTYKELHELGFSLRVIEGIQLLTKVKGQAYEEYVAGILTNIDAIRVKLADVQHNSDIRRLKGLTEKDFKRMQKYAELYQTLKAAEAAWPKDYNYD